MLECECMDSRAAHIPLGTPTGPVMIRSALLLVRRAVGAAAETVAVVRVGLESASEAMRIERARMEHGARAPSRTDAPAPVTAAKSAAAELLECPVLDPEVRALLVAAAAVAHHAVLAQGLAGPAAPGWSELTEGQQWALSEQASRVEAGRPVDMPGWSDDRRIAFGLAVRQVLARHVVARQGGSSLVH